MAGGIADLVLDRPTSWWSAHVLFEVGLVSLSLGLVSHKQIAAATGRSERTVRQHAVSVYRKSGRNGRAELAAFFLDDLILPPP